MLAVAYGIKNIGLKKSLIISITVGMFHFIMPLIGNYLGISLFEYTYIKPKYILFLIFLILSMDMLIHFFEKTPKLRNLNLFGVILFALSVSFDSLSVGLGISLIYDNILLACACFCIISFILTFLGFCIGSKISKKLGNFAFLLSFVTLLIYSIYVLTK